MDRAERPPQPSPGAVALVVLAWAALFAVRLLGPPDLTDNDQERPAAYMLDAAVNGDWICQRDQTGDVASKPPLWTWIAAGAATLSGPGIFALWLPGALATLASALLVLFAGTRRLGAAAGLAAAAMWIASSTGAKHVALARTDALFAATTFATALLAFRAWERGTTSAWTSAWLAAAAATLTKGPLGVALAAAGLLAVAWEKRSGLAAAGRGDGREPSPALRGNHLPGIALWLALALGWFALAWRAEGRDVFDKMIGRELVGHIAKGDDGAPPLVNFYKPFLYFLSRFAPWSVFALAGIARAVRRPSADDGERRFERFLIAYLGTGVALFSVAPHQRPDHLLPLLPAAALLAGRELAALSPRSYAARLSGGRGAWAVAPALAVFVAVVAIGGEVRRRSDDKAIRTTAEAFRLAEALRPHLESGARIEFPDCPYTVQFRLGVHRRAIGWDEAQAILRGDERAIVVAQEDEIDEFLEGVRASDASAGARFAVVAAAETGGKRRRVALANFSLPTTSPEATPPEPRPEP